MAGRAEMRPTVSWWPFGSGMIMAQYAGEKGGEAVVTLRARSDEQVGSMELGGEVPDEEWDRHPDAPEVSMVFRDAEALQAHIDALRRLADGMRKED